MIRGALCVAAIAVVGMFAGDAAVPRPEMVEIPGGTFRMGSDVGRGDERPVHSVRVATFLMGATPVTVGDFRTFVAATGYRTEAELGDGCVAFVRGGWTKKPGLDWREPGFAQGTDHPVTCVSWNDAQAYISWLNTATGRRYRLPTEAEWEYAARTGTADRSPTNLEASAWVQDNSGGAAHPVRLKLPDSHGLYDILGNVWEWCSDWYGDYPVSPQADPRGPASGVQRVNRGGAWYGADWSCLTRRGKNPPDDRGNGLGFRLAADVTDPPG